MTEWWKTRGRGLPLLSQTELDQMFDMLETQLQNIPPPPWLKCDNANKVKGRGRGRGLKSLPLMKISQEISCDKEYVNSVASSNFEDDAEETQESQIDFTTPETENTILTPIKLSSDIPDFQLAESNSPQLNESKSPQLNESNSPQLNESNSPQLNESNSPQLNESNSPQLNESNSPQLNECNNAQLDESKVTQLDEFNAESNGSSLAESNESSLAQSSASSFAESCISPLAETSASPFEVANNNLSESKEPIILSAETKAEQLEEKLEFSLVNNTPNLLNDIPQAIPEQKLDESIIDSAAECSGFQAGSCSINKVENDILVASNSQLPAKLNIEVSTLSSALEPIDIHSDPNILLEKIENNFNNVNKVSDLEKHCQITPIESPFPHSSSSPTSEENVLELAIGRKLYKKHSDASESISSIKLSKGNGKKYQVPSNDSSSNRKVNTGAIRKQKVGNRAHDKSKCHARKVKPVTDTSSSDSNDKTTFQYQQYYERVRTPSPHHLSPRSKYRRPLSNPKLDSEKEFPKLISGDQLIAKSKARSEYVTLDKKPSFQNISSYLKSKPSAAESVSNNCSSSDSNEATSFLDQYKVPVVKKLEIRNIVHERCEENLKGFISSFGVVTSISLKQGKESFTAIVWVEFKTSEELDGLTSSIEGIESSQFDPNSSEYDGETSSSLKIEMIVHKSDH